MVQANELTIGNYLKAIKGTGYLKVSCIKKDYIETDGELNRYKSLGLDKYEGIPLTPEILEGCGFAVPDGFQSTVLFKDNVMIDLHMGKYKLRNQSTAPLNFLHELQNIYFALTGQELEINLNPIN